MSTRMISAANIDRARAVPIEDEIARRGVRLRGKIELVGPCPVCGGADRFAVNTRKQLWNCRHCGVGGNVITLVQHLDGIGFREAIETLIGEAPRKSQHFQVDLKSRSQPPRPQPRQSADDYEREQARKAQWLWLQRCPIANSPAERYLREARGYRGPLPATLGFLPPSKPEQHPAMIAAFALAGEAAPRKPDVNPATGLYGPEPDHDEPSVLETPSRVHSVHLTLLKPDGSGKADVKPNKLIVGSPLGRPIILAPPNDLLGLAITEGIEDALSVHQATGLGAWAAGAAGFMPGLADVVPSYIECVTIYAHPDPAGQNGARKLADALVRRGIEVRVSGMLARSLTDREIVSLVGGDR